MCISLYSVRNACIGSTREARRAGQERGEGGHGDEEPDTAARVAGSEVPTPYTNCATSRPAASEAASPSASPAIVGRRP